MRALRSSTFLALVTALGGVASVSPAHAATVGTITDKTLPAGSDYSFSVSVSGGSLNTTATLSRGRYRPGSPGNCNVTAMNSNGVETVPGATVSLPFNFTGGTVSWPKEHNAYQVGPHCFRLRACDRFFPITCDNEYFHVNVAQSGIIHWPLIFAHRDRIVVPADPEPSRQRVGAWSMRMSGSTPISDLLRLDSCPTGYSCSPPSIPSWVTLSSTANDGLEFVFDVPSGPAGEFVFTQKIPRLDREVEGNDDFLTPNVLTTQGSIRASISPSSDVDWLKFYAEAGDTFSIRTSTSATSSTSCSTVVDTYIRLFSDDGTTQLTANDASNTNQCSRIIYTASSSQWFYLSVEEHGQNSTISNYYTHLSGTDDVTDAIFSLHALSPEDVTPPQVVADESLKHFPEIEAKNDSVDSAPSIQGSGVVSGAIDPANDSDRFRFVVGESTGHSFVVSNADLGCSFDARLSLYKRQTSGSLTLITESNDVGASTCPQIPFLELDRGHYVVILQEDGNNAPIYHYLLDHRTYALEVEPANNSVSTAHYLNASSPGAVQAFLGGESVDYFQQFGAQSPGVWGYVGAAGDTSDYYVIAPDTPTIFAETGDGQGGCPGDTRLSLYRWSVLDTPPEDGPGSLFFVASDDSSGAGLCSRLTYNVPVGNQDYYHVIRVTRDGGGVVGPYLLRYGTDDPSIPLAPDWAEEGFLQQKMFGYDSNAIDLTYGGYYGMYAAIFNGTGADIYSAYDQTSINDSNCDNPINLYLFTTSELRDGDGVCRSFSGELTQTQTSNGWRKTRTVAGPMLSYAPTSSHIGTTTGRAMFGAIKTGNQVPNRADDDTEATGNLSAVELDVVSGDNELTVAHFGECDGGIIGAPPTENTCSVDAEFHEGEYFTFPLRRFNRLTAVEFRRCFSAADASCGQSLLGATYSTSSDEIRWTIPSTVTSSSTFIYFRVRSIGNAARGESDDVYRIRIRVRNRSSSVSGADLAFERVVEIHPGTYSTVDSRASFIGMKKYPFGGGILYDPRSLYRSTFGSSSYRTRSMGALDNIYLHPLMEMGELGDANGPSRLEVRVRNRGTVSSASTYVDAYKMPAIFDNNGNYAGGVPTVSDTPFDTAFVSSTSAGSVRNAYIDMPTHILQPNAGALPWDGGGPAIVYLKIRSGAVNNLEGPFVVTAPPRVPLGACFICSNVTFDLTGGIASVSPAVPVEGQSVGVSFTETYTGIGWIQTQRRFYLNQTAPPTSATPYTTQIAGPASPVGSLTYGGTFTFTAAKPDNATNEIPVRVLLNATGVGNEATPSNNHLPSFSDPLLIEIANTPPAFVSAPSSLTFTEDQTTVRTWTVTDQNVVDRSRLTFSQVSGPALTFTSSLSACGNNSCINTSFRPTDAQAAAEPLTVVLRVCDGDPVAGGAGACTDQSITFNINRINDRPSFTTPDGPTTATEGTLYTYNNNATDEETPGNLTFSLISRPSGMSINSSTGVISWTPVDSHVPLSNFVRVRVRDIAPPGTTGTQSRDQTWFISVANINDAPVIDFFSPTTGTEGFTFTSDARVTDADVDSASISQPLSCTLLGAPAFLSAFITTAPGVRVCRITGTPNDPDTGPLSFTVRVSDSITTTNRAVNLTIANQNEAPTFLTNPGFVNATQGSAFSINLFAADPDLNSPVANESLTFTQLGGPTATLTPSTSSVGLVWTPGPADAGTAPVITIRVRDQAGLTDVVDIRFNAIGNVNDTPYFSPAPPDLVFDEGDVVAAQILAGDPDLDAGFSETLSYSIVSGAPPNLVISPSTGALSLSTPGGRADDDQVGLWTVRVRVQDDQSPTPAFAEDDFLLDIGNINDVPEITSTAPTVATEDAAFSYAPTASDPDFPETLTWTASGLPSWLSQSSATGTLTSLVNRPNNDDVGVHAFTIRVTDLAGTFDELSLSITVANTNDAPAITSTALTGATQDIGYLYVVTGTDADLIHGDQLTWSAPQIPLWMSFNSTTRQLVGTPNNADVGTHPVTLRVQDDDGAFAQQPFSIVVANVNDAPVLASIGSRQVNESELLSFSVSASDPDGTTPTLTVAPGTLPAGAAFNGVTFSWTPNFGEAGNYTVRFVASDTVLTDFEDVIVTVGDVNRPPVLNPVGAQSVDEGNLLSFVVSASDPDVGDTLTLSAEAGGGGLSPLAAGATFNPASGAFAFAPDFNEAGTYTVRFRVTDTELDATELVTIVVGNINRAPAFTSSPVTGATEDTLYAYAASAPDADGDAVNYAFVTRPVGMTLNAGSGAIAWTPTNAQVGEHPVVLAATDGNGGEDTQSFSITVVDLNDAPFFTSVASTDATEDEAFLYTAAASDIDAGDNVTLSAPTLPTWLLFSPGTGELAGTPENADVGDHPVVLSALDDRGASVTQAFTIVVTNVNDAPVLVAPTPSGTLSVAEGATLAFTVAASDVDGPALSYQIVGLPVGATFNAATGAFSWTPDFASAGTRALTLIADDTLVQTTQPLTIDVANTDRAPVLTAPATASGSEGLDLAFSVSASDPDGDGIVLEMTSGPAGANFVPGTGIFQWVPSFDDAGTVTASFRATAGALFDTADVSITIANVNRAPAVQSTPVVVATEDIAYSYDIDATDPDGDVLTFTATTLPTGAAVDPVSGLVTWTPSGAQTGSRSFSVDIADPNGGLVVHAFVVEVTEVNDFPTFTSSPLTTATEDIPYVYPAAAVDPDDGSLSFSLVQGPPGMAVGAASGQLTFTPRNADVGTHPVEVLVSDGRGGTDTQAFNLVVENVNDAPVIASIPAPAPTVLQDQPFSFTPAVSDVDVGDAVALSLISAPTELTLVAGTLSWSPGNSDVGPHTIEIRATDNAGAFDSLTFGLVVVNLNDVPTFVSLPIDAVVTEESTFTEIVDALDPDVGDTLTFSLVGAPATAAVDNTGLFTFSPDDAEVGDHNFTIRVEDDAGAADELPVHLVVTPVNDPPVLQAIGSRQVAIGGSLDIALIATDPDNASLTFTMTGAPAGATLVDNLFSWPTTVSDAGAHLVTFRVSDGALDDEEAVTLVVGDGGLPPSISVPADIDVDEGDTIQETVSAIDPDTADAVPVSAAGLPAGATFVAGVFDWTPGFDDDGSYTITFAASNGSGTSTRTWTVVVGDQNRSPVLTTISLPEAVEGTPYSPLIEATDPDGDALSFALLTSPPTMTINSVTGALAFLPVFVDVGDRTVEVRVSDGSGGVTIGTFPLLVRFLDVDSDLLPDTWEVAVGTDPTVNDADLDPDLDGLSNLEEYLGGTDPFVSGAPSAPALLEPFDGARVDTATPTLRFGTSVDPDDDVISYRVVIVPDDSPGTTTEDIADLTFAGLDGELTVTVVLDEGRTYRWSVTATDGVGFGVSETRTFVVDAVNVPPPAPTLLAPADGATVAFASPTLEASRVLDPDGDSLTYQFIVRDGSSTGPIVETSPALTAPETGPIQFTVGQAFATGTSWFWTVQATDARGETGPAAPQSSFTVDLENLPPPAPVVLNPSDGRLDDTDTVIRVAAVEDPEGLPVTYDFALSFAATFDPIDSVVVTGLVDDGSGVVSYDASALTPDGLWGLRVTAFDGVVRSEVAEVVFELDLVNEAPSVVSLLAPDDNSEVDALPALFRSTTATDPDGDALEYRVEILEAGTDAVLSSAVMELSAAPDEVEVALATFDAGDVVRWRVVAAEVDGPLSSTSAIRSFRVADANLRPQAPIFVVPTEGDVVENLDEIVFAAADDPEGDLVTHDFEIEDDEGTLVFAESLLVADGEGEVIVDVGGALAPGAYLARARGRDVIGAGPYASVAFVFDPPPPPDGGALVDAGTPPDDAGVDIDAGTPDVDAGAEVDAGVIVEDDTPVVTDVGYRPVPTASSCGGCSQTPPELSLGAGLALLLALIRRRSRRRRSNGKRSKTG